MKKLTLFLISASLITFLVIGCGKKTNGSEDNTDKLQNTEQQINDSKQNNSSTNANSVNDNKLNNTDPAKGKVIQLTTPEFKEKVFDFENNQQWIYNGTLPCVIDFYADWCRPCKMVAPIMEELAKEYAGKVIFYKVNVDNERQVAQVFGIQNIPSVLFVPQEGQPQMAVGAMQKEGYINAIKSVLGVK